MPTIYYPQKEDERKEKLAAYPDKYKDMGVNQHPVVSEDSTYYTAEPDMLLHENMTILERLIMELNHKKYYSDKELCVWLNENGLYYDDIYDKNVHYRPFLCTVLGILESLANNIDVFRSVETEFATTSEAYKYLERRIQRLQQTISNIPDEPILGGRGSDFTHIYKD